MLQADLNDSSQYVKLIDPEKVISNKDSSEDKYVVHEFL